MTLVNTSFLSRDYFCYFKIQTVLILILFIAGYKKKTFVDSTIRDDSK